MGQGDAGRAELKERIRTDVTEGMEKTQREFLLRQQMAAIRKELGEDGDDDDASTSYRTKARRGATRRDECVRAAVEREIDRLERTARAEHRARLDPHLARHRARAAVGCPHRRPLDIGDARRILDADHTGSTR